MADVGHFETDAVLAEIEKRVAAEYRQATKETQEKLDDYLRRFQTKDAAWQRMVADGKKTQAEYNQWRTGQIMIGQRWQDMVDTLSQDYHNANDIARSIVRGYMPEVYALNHNYATFQVEQSGRVDTSYTLYSRETVERIVRENPELLPPPGPRMKASIAAGKDIAWQAGQLQSVMLQSILQGESIPNISKRIANTMGETNHKSTIRYARTAATAAQNAGRIDAYRRAEEMGIDLEIEWRATLDMRTRHSHRQLDGQRRKVGEPFEFYDEAAGWVEIMFPGDWGNREYKVPESAVWNCRCTLLPRVAGWESKTSNLRSDAAIEGMTYDEWKESRIEKPHRITKQEEIAELMRRRYIRELYSGR